MKKILLLALLVAFSFTTQAQRTYEIANQLKLKTVPVGASNDSIVTVNSNGLIRHVAKSSIAQNADGSETKINSGTGNTITGIGTVASPYIINSNAVSVSTIGIVDNTSLQELGGVDKLINGVRIGKGNSNVATNTVVGDLALALNTTAGWNTAIGSSTLSKVTVGQANTAVGSLALMENISGGVNTAVGYKAMTLAVSSNNNTSIGGSSLKSLVSGNYNTAVGSSALALNTMGGNTAVGASSLYSNVSGSDNTVFGYSSGFYNLGSNNVAFGTYSLSANGTYPTGNTGSLNIVLGIRAARNLTTGSGNIIVESTTENTSPYKVTSGNNNLIIRQSANNTGSGISTGSGNTVIGNVVGLGDVSNNIAIGDGAGNTRVRFNGTDWTFAGQINKVALDTAPATATSTGVIGEIRYTATGIYICTATDTWLKCVGSTF